jgi:uncharacterized protein with HEPN domain
MWRDDAWLLDMLQSAQRALDYASGLSENQFMADNLRQDAILRQLTILGEASKKISNELRTAHPDIPWRKVAGFRDVVVHDYFGVDLKEVWRIIRDDLPSLVKLLEPLVPPEESKT